MASHSQVLPTSEANPPPASQQHQQQQQHPGSGNPERAVAVTSSAVKRANKMASDDPDIEEPSGPAYCRPIIANLLPEYTNASAEAIRQAFLPTSFRSIGSLHGLGPDPEKPAFRVPRCSNMPFSDFEYACSPYEAEEDLKAHERKEHMGKMRRIAGDQEIIAFRTAFAPKREKFDPIWDTPFLSEPYQDADNQSMTREKMLQSAAEKPFVPAGVQKSIGKPTRALLNDAMTSLFRCLAEDWPDAQPTVLTTAEDLIVVYFPLEQIRNPDGVATYMNHALRRNEVVLEFDLRKVIEGWNVKTDDGFLLFSLRPPWVKARDFIKAAKAEEAQQAKLMGSFNTSVRSGSGSGSPQKQIDS